MEEVRWNQINQRKAEDAERQFTVRLMYESMHTHIHKVRTGI